MQAQNSGSTGSRYKPACCGLQPNKTKHLQMRNTPTPTPTPTPHPTPTRTHLETVHGQPPPRLLVAVLQVGDAAVVHVLLLLAQEVRGHGVQAAGGMRARGVCVCACECVSSPITVAHACFILHHTVQESLSGGRALAYTSSRKA